MVFLDLASGSNQYFTVDRILGAAFTGGEGRGKELWLSCPGFFTALRAEALPSSVHLSGPLHAGGGNAKLPVVGNDIKRNGDF